MFKKVSSKLDFPRMEQEILHFWEQGKFLQKIMKKNNGGKRFSFLDGPITANNPMGVHHAWGRAYKDIFQRYKAMRGFDQRYQNGFDCQGLWVEVEVEKELGFTSKKDIEKYGIDRFVEKCKERVHKYSMVQTEQSIRLGQWMDWGEWKTGLNDPDWMKKSHSYYTMSDVNNYTIWHFLKACHKKGWIYKGRDVMPWCPRCGTAISDMEIATEGYREITHKTVVLRLPVLSEKDEYLLVWTTTPWTLTSNTAVAVHPELTYVKVSQEDKIYYLSKETLSVIQGSYKVIEELSGKKLLDLEYMGPFDEMPPQKGVRHRVIPWKEVSEAEGTGIVHIAPGCGKEDFLLSKEFKLSVIAPIDETGCFVDGFEWLSGKNANETAEPIMEDLKKKGMFYRSDDYVHRYPVCWRCDSELLFRLVDEWYISMDDLRHKIMKSAKKVKKWIPSFGLDRELDWLRNMSDWCISKKRYWGLALPVWECECGHFTVVGSKDELKKKAAQGWSEFEGHSPHRPWVDSVKIKCEKCGKTTSRIPDVGNPWLDAGIVPFSTIGVAGDTDSLQKVYPYSKSYWKKWFPAHFITECFPGQFRNWFYAILAMSTALEDKPAFEVLLGHGLVKDEHGEEMHKSRGNAIPFEDAAENIGADVMRWMFASHDPAQNLNFGYGIAGDVKRRFLLLWNVYSFFITYAVIDGFDPLREKPEEVILTRLDRWILSRLNYLLAFAGKCLDDYSVAPVTREIERFVDDLSTWWLRRSRRRIWKPENDVEKETAYSVLYECLVNLVKILAPIVPFLAEDMYQNLVCSLDKNAPESIHLCDFPKADTKKIDQAIEDEMKLVRLIVSLGRAARNKAGIKVRQPLDALRVKVAAPSDRLGEASRLLIQDELNVKHVDGKSDMDGVYRYNALPRFEKLGPRFGKSAGMAAEWIKSFSDQEIKQLRDKGYIEGRVDGKTVRIDKGDVELKKDEVNDWTVVTEGECSVAINTMISDGLLREGLAREFVHKVQMLRKDADFKISDRIKIAYRGFDVLKEAVGLHSLYIKDETLAVEIKEGGGDGEIVKTESINGRDACISLERVAKFTSGVNTDEKERN